MCGRGEVGCWRRQKGEGQGDEVYGRRGRQYVAGCCLEPELHLGIYCGGDGCAGEEDDVDDIDRDENAVEDGCGGDVSGWYRLCIRYRLSRWYKDCCGQTHGR